MTKIGEIGHVATEVLAKICTALDCTLDDIMENVNTSAITRTCHTLFSGTILGTYLMLSSEMGDSHVNRIF